MIRAASLLMVVFLVSASFIGLSIGNGAEEAAVRGSEHLCAASAARGPLEGAVNGLYGGMVRYDDVALLVNDNSAISKEIGTYFAMRRGVPAENIINLSVPAQETIAPSEFDELARQVKENLSERGLTNKVQYIVTTKGVPLRVSGSNWRMSSVDSELMLLDSVYEGSIHGNYWIDNPFFEAWGPFSREEYGIRLVTRLDGYTMKEAMGLIDLAEPSLGVRGRALLDTDPSKGYQASGYGIGNFWMVNAHEWLTENGHESLLDMNNTFRTGWTNTSAYFSWGSNDGDWSKWLLSNSDFERGTGSVPAVWRLYQFTGTAERTQDVVDSGSYSLKMTRSTIYDTLLVDQLYDIEYPDHRFIFDGRAKLESVTNGPARAFIEGFDKNGAKVYFKEFYNRTGTRNWESFQGVVENRSDMVRIRAAIELAGAGTAYWDNLVLRAIRPHNRWVPGSIAETCVSTGGRSMAYGTWYGQSLVADLIRDGVTGVKGYVYEPFLSSISHADILFPAYYSSYNLAESYWMGSEYGSWMDTVLGDPKCAPYLNERPDMGFPERMEPIVAYVEAGDPRISVALYNKGRGAIPGGGLVDLYVDGLKVDSFIVSLAPGELRYLNISYRDYPEILGPHNFSVLLNSDGAVWEMDPYNNMAYRELSVNRLPRVDVAIDGSEVERTASLNISVNISDEDAGIDLGRLELYILDPFGRRTAPSLIWERSLTTSVEAVFEFSPSWNATLGFYSVDARYEDKPGSEAASLLYGALKVLNSRPALNGSISNSTPLRGDEVAVTLDWLDRDTPEGDLIVSVWTKGPSGEIRRPRATEPLSPTSCRYVFDLPPQEMSRVWDFEAVAVDRDGSEARWEGSLRTVNGLPWVKVVSGLKRTITRLGSATVALVYTDPEGLPPSKIEARLLGPTVDGNGPIVLQRELSGKSGEELYLFISGSDLSIGNYTLEVLFEDDERAGSELIVADALTVVNIPPELGNVTVTYPEGEDVPGLTVMRGSAFTIRVPVRDEDGDMWTVEATASLIGPSSEVMRDLVLDSIGDWTFQSRVQVGTEWDLGGYGLRIDVADQDGGSAGLNIGLLVMVDAPQPLLASAKVILWANLTCVAEVMFSPIPGSTLPVYVRAEFRDVNGTTVGISQMYEGGQKDLWTANLTLTAAPRTVVLKVIDDLGRNLTFTAEIDIRTGQDPPPPVDDGDRSRYEDVSLLYIILALVLVVLLVLMVLVAALVVRRLREPDLKAAPPMASHLGPSIQGSLPPKGPTGLSEGPVHAGLPPAPLPPGMELNDGSLYHKPDQKAPDKARGRPSRQEDGEVIHELGPRRPPLTVPADVPMASAPAPSDGPPAPVPFDVGQSLNNGSVVAPQKADVPDTHHNDLPGDTGQGVSEG